MFWLLCEVVGNKAKYSTAAKYYYRYFDQLCLIKAEQFGEMGFLASFVVVVVCWRCPPFQAAGAFLLPSSWREEEELDHTFVDMCVRVLGWKTTIYVWCILCERLELCIE